MTPQELRQSEKARYVATNAALLDSAERWKAYEDLILRKYLPPNAEPARFPSLCWHEQALDLAWAARDRHHLREVQEN